jgi:ParB family chromosome partitioning protein
MAELVASVKSKGVLQPLLVRPFDGDLYEIIAGERRYRAALEAFGDQYEIEARVFDNLSDSQVLELAIIENSQRKDISVTEEAVAASRLLGLKNGDRSETAAELGWDLVKLDKRLALMACTEEVRLALTKDEIKLGHAELIATLAPERQAKALQQVIEQGVTVESLRSAIEKYALVLSSAIFDKTECNTCPHNSSTQASLFSTTMASGMCQRSSCFDEKTNAALEVKKAELLTEYAVVRFIRPGEQFTAIPLIADGATGVGLEQASACRVCENFGASISALPGSMGDVAKEQCLSPSCNATMVAKRVKAEKQAVAAKAEAKATSKPAAKAPQSAASAKTSPKVDAAPAVTIEYDKVRTAIKEYREKLWRTALAKYLNRDWAVSCTALASLFVAGRFPYHMSKGSEVINNSAQKLLGVNATRGNLPEVLLAAESATDPEAIRKLVQRLAPAACMDIDLSSVQELLAHYKVNLLEFFKLDQVFMEMLTKPELEYVSELVGIKAAMDPKQFAKAVSGKKTDFVSALLSVEGFDYVVLPAFLNYKNTKDLKND